MNDENPSLPPSASDSAESGRTVAANAWGRLTLAFHHPGFSLLWANSLFSGIGLWMEMVAQGWLVLELTDSPFLLGLAAASRGVAMLLCGAWGGGIADRGERRRLMVVAQTGSVALSLLMGTLVATGHIQVWQILGVAMLSGATMAFQTPA